MKKKIILELDNKDIDTIEDRFFCNLTKKQYKKIKPKLLKIWKQICDEDEKR